MLGDFSVTKKSVGNRKLKKEDAELQTMGCMALEVQKNLRT